MKRLMLILTVCLLALSASLTLVHVVSGKAYIYLSKEPAVEWEKTYGGADEDVARCVQQTNDGGYIVVGYTKSFGAGKTDIWLVKVNNVGDILWSKTYGDADYDWGNYIEPGVDGGYIIAGTTCSFGSGDMDVWLIKIDEGGSVEWSKTFGGPRNDQAKCIRQTKDGGYIIAGTTSSFGTSSDFYLLKIDKFGNLKWSKTYGGNQDDEAYCVQQTNDGGYIVVGYTGTLKDGFNVWLVKVDEAGGIHWDKFYSAYRSRYNRAYCVQQTNDGGYIIVGDREFAGTTDAWVFKVDKLGNIEWEKRFETPGFGGVDFVRETADGGYIIAGSFDWGNNLDAWVFKVDKLGTLQWSKIFGGSFDDKAYCVQETRDEGIIMAGAKSIGKTSISSKSDFLLVKLEDNMPPYIGVPSHKPSGQTVDMNQEVLVSVKVTDKGSGVDKVILAWWTNRTLSWSNIIMSYNYATGLYEGIISQQKANTYVKYKIIAYDKAGNSATEDNSGQFYTYIVIPVPQFLTLVVSLTLSPTTANSGTTVSVYVHVTNGTSPVKDATIHLVSDKGGTFKPQSGYTDLNGDFTSTFTVPSVSEQTKVAITATASKSGYNDGSDHDYITVHPLKVVPPSQPQPRPDLTLWIYIATVIVVLIFIASAVIIAKSHKSK